MLFYDSQGWTNKRASAEPLSVSPSVQSNFLKMTKGDEAQNHTPGAEEQELLRRRSTAKMVFTKKVKHFEERVRLKDPFDALQISYNNIDDRFKILEDLCLELVDYYSKNSFSQGLIDDALEYNETCERVKCEKYLELLEAKTDSLATSDQDKGAFSKIKLDNVKMPKFEGKIREFPGFLDDYARLVIPNHRKNPSVLKQCLVGEALELVRNRDTDHDEMME